MPASTRSDRLAALLEAINSAGKTILEEWAKEDSQANGSLTPASTEARLPSPALYDAQRTIVGSCGAVSALVQNPDRYLLVLCGQYLESRALHIANEHRIADILASAADCKGVHIDDLSSKTGVDASKLERIMRVLCSVHVFEEVQQHRFANNAISSEMISNPGIYGFIYEMATSIFTATDKLPALLSDPVKGASTSVTCSAFQEFLGRPVSFWDWLEEKVPQPDGSLKPNPHVEMFAASMISWGRTTARPLYREYPWGDLGNATVVDVGGGEGGMSLDLSKIYPQLNFVLQDRSAVLAHARDLWRGQAPEALDRVSFITHDFFTENPVKGAEIYMLRHIMHDWDDEHCVQILKGIQASMGPTSQLLVADHVMNNTLGFPELSSAPEPLPANYGYAERLGNILDLDMLVLLNGIERTPPQFRALASRAGLEVVRIWECRGHDQIAEMRLPVSL